MEISGESFSAWDALEIFDTTVEVRNKIAALDAAAQHRVTEDIKEVFELVLRSLLDAWAARRRYHDVEGFEYVWPFLSGRLRRLGVTWTHSNFSMCRNEYGAICIDRFDLYSGFEIVESAFAQR